MGLVEKLFGIETKVLFVIEVGVRLDVAHAIIKLLDSRRRHIIRSFAICIEVEVLLVEVDGDLDVILVIFGFILSFSCSTFS